VVGLGNPEPRYAGTRHNAGQAVVEAVAERLGLGRFTSRYAGRFADGRGPAGPLAALVPTTYMNASGDSVGPAAGTLRAAPGQVLVVHDEIDLPFGVVRGKVGGGVAGHNGLRSVAAGLGTREFPRVRLGVGRPPADFRGDGADWVLTRFAEPREEVEAMLERGVAMVEAALAEGIDAAIARFHAAEPGSRARERQARRGSAAGGGPDVAPGDAPEDPRGAG